MADVSERGLYSTHKNATTYFPALPPKIRKHAVSYTTAIMSAPYTALMGVVVDGRKPSKHPVTPRCRERRQVGNTNRWRIPDSLGGDLLASNQAVKSITVPYNTSMVKIITAEGPRTMVNADADKPYQFRQQDDRPSTMPAPVALYDRGSVPKIPSTAPVRGISTEPLQTFAPLKARTPKPLDVFQYHSKQTHTATGPDVLLQCLDINWELHSPFLQKSDTLSELLRRTQGPQTHSYYRNPTSDTLDNYIKKNSFYSNAYTERESKFSGIDLDLDNLEDYKGTRHPKHVSQPRTQNMIALKLRTSDLLITQHCMAVALGHLYREKVDVDICDVVGVLAAANLLKCRFLIEGCATVMLRSITTSTVCEHHRAARIYHQDQVLNACERWLELNLVPKLSTQIQLRDVPIDLMQKVLRSNRLFTFNEHALCKVICYWVFLQMNPGLQLMPSYSTVLMYFSSLPKNSALIEREEGQQYAPLFMALRLHGITDTANMQDLQQMNIIPKDWIVNILTEHYHALQAGGDMFLMTNFHASCVRQGFIVDEEPHYHSEIFSLHGFHFELKAVKQTGRKGTYTFYMQRLKPGDPILSFRQCERHTFSMRPDRDVKYSMRISYIDTDSSFQSVTTGMLAQRFGLGTKTSKSEVVTLENMKSPIYVTFSFLFPQS